MNDYRQLFLLDPAIHFLNHGSFGACPQPVFEVYQEWQRRLERQPVLFLSREFASLELTARQALGRYLNADAADLVFIPNATYGVNIIARSLKLGSGNEILTTDHEYGACNNAWNFICQQTGARYLRRPIHLPIASRDAFTNQLWGGVSSRTKLIYLSHITSSTAQLFPVEAVCRRARDEGILTCIDGAHAPGQLTLDLQQVGADFYTGNCHKWLLSPKGAAFLYAQKEVQNLVEPLVVSWGSSADEKTTTGSRFIDLLQWTGTHDPAAALTVPAAIQFIQEHRWDEVRLACTEILTAALEHISGLTGQPPAYSGASPSRSELLPPQMGIARLPQVHDLEALKTRLYDEYQVEAPLIEWGGQSWIRISVQGYNTWEDIQALLEALSNLLP